MEREKTNYGKIKKVNYLFVSVSHPCNEKNIAKSMTILKLCERSFKWDLSGSPNFNRLEMALGWRQAVKNLEIYHMILRGYLYFNIDIKRIKWDICSWRHFKVIYLIRRKCAFKDVISNKHTDLLIIGPSCTLKWTNPVLFRISEPYLVSCKFFFSFDPIFLHLKLVKKGVIFAWCGQFV